MSVIISKESIEKTIVNLHYAENSVKRKLVDLIMNTQRHNDESTPDPIDTDQLISQLWDIDDPDQIVFKRKNFNSLKSSVNNDFSRLYRNGLNPDGIVIGDKNFFDISNEARDTIFSKFATGTGQDRTISLERLFELLQVIDRAVSSTDLNGTDLPKQNEHFLARLDKTLSTVIEKFSKSEEDETESPEKNDDEQPENDNFQEDSESLEEKALNTLEYDDDYEIVEEIIEEIDDEDDNEIEDDDIVQEETIEEEIIEEIDDDAEDYDVVEEEIEEIEEIVDIEDGENIDESEEVEEEEYDEGKYSNFNDEMVEVIETGLSVDLMDEDPEKYLDDSLVKDSILLDENLDGFLGSMERFYNQYILIEEGRYIIGTKKPERHEKKRKKISLEDFYMGKFPVTNLLFSVFVNQTGYVTTAERLGYGMVYTGRFLKKINPNTGRTAVVLNSALSCKKISGACWHRPLGIGSDLNQKRNHPVVMVSIEDAKAFAQWSKKRIPTEAEWEAGTRTQKGFIFPWGKKWKKNQCNIEATANADTTPVDQYREWENELGIVDCLGNVLEWTCTNVTVNQKKYYITKGGSWVSNNAPRLYQRFLYLPDYSSNIIGFRCVASEE
ncbi:Sulphatase-modifying factor domain protein [Candidatus Magnetomorum sp. HK-1]|nr:Sulphatase-modifying factor domain protein [Candidatus Magnetomorum sp. HK-1]